MSSNPRKRAGDDWRKMRVDKRARRTEDLAAVGLELSEDGRVKPLGTADGTSADEIVRLMDPAKRQSLNIFFADANEPAPPMDAATEAAIAALTPEAGLDAVSPLWRMPYIKQLSKKRNEVVKAMRKILRETRAQYKQPGVRLPTELPQLPYAGFSARDLICPLGLVTPSPVLTGYRNKNEFTFGLNPQGERDLGFQLGRFAGSGETRVGSPTGCLTAPSAALAIADLLAAFIRSDAQQDLSVWDKRAHTGFLRQVTVRTSDTLGQMMVVVQVSPAAFGGADSERVTQFKADLKGLLIKHCYAGALSAALVDKYNAAHPDAPVAPPAAVLVAPADAPADADITPEARAFAAAHGCSLASVAVEYYDGISNAAGDAGTVTPLFGGAHIYDLLSGKVFRVDYKSFFQVNPRGAEGLYAKAAQWALAPRHDWSLGMLETTARYVAPSADEAREWLHKVQCAMSEKKQTAAAAAAAAADTAEGGAADSNAAEGDATAVSPAAEDAAADDEDDGLRDDSPHCIGMLMKAGVSDTPRLPAKPDAAAAARTLVLDVCCGTGTIGLTMAGHVKRTVGLEIVPAAIEDAKANAALNGVTNAEFVCGKAEQTIKAVLSKCAGEMDMAVAIVDPPRGGLHNDVVAALRNSKLNRVVYVSCNPATLAENVMRLAGPASKRYGGAPFVPIAAQAVDMFPHTAHCELVMLLERMPEDVAAARVSKA